MVEVPGIGAYTVVIRIDGESGPSYWSTRRVLVDAETQLLPGQVLSTDVFSPIKNYTLVKCTTGPQGADSHAVQEILLGRMPVLHDEIVFHTTEADELARRALEDAPADLRAGVLAALRSSQSVTKVFQTLSPLRRKYGLPEGTGESSRRLPQGKSDPSLVPQYSWTVETIWLLYFAASKVEEDIHALSANLEACETGPTAQLPPDPEVTLPQPETATPQPVPPAYTRPADREPAADPIAVASDGLRADWSGFYLGGHAGFATAPADYRAGVGALSVPISIDGDGFLGGILVGYNVQFDRFVVGLEGDLSFGDIDGGNTLAGFSNPRLEMDFLATVRARFGYAWDQILMFASVGLGYAEADVRESLQLAATTNTGNEHFGFTVGAGLEWAVSETVMLRSEYLYGNFERRGYTIGPAADSIEFDVHIVRAAVAVKLGR